MRLTLLGMLSTNSLAAFSGVNATGSLDRSGSARLVRSQQGASEVQPTPAVKRDIPDAMPNRNLPRGSLLNLAV